MAQITLRLGSCFLLASVLVLPFKTEARASKVLDLVVNVPATTPPNDTIYVSGNVSELCSWKPDCIALKPIGNDDRSYRATITLPSDVNALEFKVTRGSWDRVPSALSGSITPNVQIKLNGAQTRIVHSVLHWSDLPPSGVSGTVETLKGVYSPQLGNKRDLYVWLPPSYADDDTRFPVIYMHDGQNLFDPRLSAYGVDWGADEAMTRIFEESGRSAIIVGIQNNGPDRWNEYDYTLKGAQYARFLIDTVKPLIDSRYRTLPSRESTFTAGSSMGGLISAALLWRHSDVFSKAAALSIAVGAHDGSILKVLDESPKPRQSIRLYFDHGNYGYDSTYKPYVRQFRDLLLRKGMSEPEFVYREFEYHDHTEADWARRVEIPFRFMLSANRPD